MNVRLLLKIFFVLFISMFVLSACSKTEKTQGVKKKAIIKVEVKPLITTLSFSGNLKPHKQYNITAPNAGVISDTGFKYGQSIKKGELLYMLDSSKQEENFESALSSYLKAKQQLSSDKGQLQSAEGLFKKGLVSRDAYTQSKNTYYLSRLSLLQAETQLQKILRFFSPDENVLTLSVSDIAEISKTLAKSKKSEKMKIISPVNGVALFPTSSGSSGSSSGDSSGDSGGKVEVGSGVKQGQVLVTIGEFKGLVISAKASEVNVNQLKIGLPATITSVAFPNITLKGSIHEIDSQATSSGGLPQFNLLILVPELSDKNKKIIKVGMSAQAVVTIKGKPEIQIPIDAVFQKNGHSMVRKRVKGKDVDTVITTGRTTAGSVVVLSGLKPGDEIVSGH